MWNLGFIFFNIHKIKQTQQRQLQFRWKLQRWRWSSNPSGAAVSVRMLEWGSSGECKGGPVVLRFFLRVYIAWFRTDNRTFVFGRFVFHQDLPFKAMGRSYTHKPIVGKPGMLVFPCCFSFAFFGENYFPVLLPLFPFPDWWQFI